MQMVKFFLENQLRIITKDSLNFFHRLALNDNTINMTTYFFMYSGLADIGCCKNILEPMRCYIGECSGHDEDTVLEECRLVLPRVRQPRVSRQ